jgi:hypothetical protein
MGNSRRPSAQSRFGIDHRTVPAFAEPFGAGVPAVSIVERSADNRAVAGECSGSVDGAAVGHRGTPASCLVQTAREPMDERQQPDREARPKVTVISEEQAESFAIPRRLLVATIGCP